MKNLFLVLFLLVSASIIAQIPAGYYDAAQGLNGDALRYKLHDIISNGYVQGSYNQLWTSYQTTDKRSDGKVWDMYSDIPGGTPPYLFTFVTDQCGTYSVEGDCYNREHSVPASWFNDAYPMYSDLFHIVPTDGYVNNRRSNYPFGKVASASWTSQNGSKLGTSAVSGYTGTVFEPIDSFKGDFARIYFYMATRYKDEIPSWSSNTVFSGDNLSAWAKNMFIQWSILDPVSAKEIARNNAVYAIQHNRNPYVDHPEWISGVWLSMNDNLSLEPEISFFPNPATEYINIGVLTQFAFSITIFDQSGRIILKKENVLGNSTLDIRNFENGVYLVKMEGQGFCNVKKLVKVSD
ncbi:MAG TPA: endonuclease [Bacteroidales bacterium]|jgi:endonuclease I|nr:endonuclease [Bacteroidales bacterium]